jgi:hypothetical protein
MRRRRNKNLHHNVYTKKYASKRAEETAWKLYLGEDEFKKAKHQMVVAKTINKQRIRE